MTSVQSRHFQPTQLRGVNRDQRTVDIVASDFSLDSYGTRIDPGGWNLDQFKKNPVICLQHDSYRGLPIATAVPESVRVENGKLLMTVQFPPEGASRDADESFNLIAAGVLRGVSVGFDPEEWKDVEEEDSGYKKNVRIYVKQRLMEVSFVTIPSNDNGMVVRSKEQNLDPEEIRKWTVGLEESLAKHEEPQVLVKKSVWDKYEGYFARKQPANRESTKVLEKFFKLRDEKQPDNEVKAWERMAEILDEPQPEPKSDPVKPEEPPAAAPVEAAPEPKEEFTPPPAPPQEAPEPQRKASVEVSLDVLLAIPGKLTRTYVESAVEALRQGLPVKDAVGLIDGMNEAVANSFQPISHGN